jgi:hypothetical protein
MTCTGQLLSSITAAVRISFLLSQRFYNIMFVHRLKSAIKTDFAGELTPRALLPSINEQSRFSKIEKLDRLGSDAQLKRGRSLVDFFFVKHCFFRNLPNQSSD